VSILLEIIIHFKPPETLNLICKLFLRFNPVIVINIMDFCDSLSIMKLDISQTVNSSTQPSLPSYRTARTEAFFVGFGGCPADLSPKSKQRPIRLEKGGCTHEYA
jgi:hypothetical protein